MTAMWSSPERRSEHCASLVGDREFEQPPCPDGHDGPGECAEWACAECVGVLMLAVPVLAVPVLAAA
jgi:hypothetical protein